MSIDKSKLPPITIIVAVDLAMGIGKDNDLLCHLSTDLKRFKQITTGHTVVMGLNTWISLPRKPLPERRHIVLSPEKVFDHPQVFFVSSVEDAIASMDSENENFIIGGGMVYETFMEYAQTLMLTVFQKTFEADTFFPAISQEEWKLVEESETMFDEKESMEYVYQTYKRIFQP
jgi:dihydrofolate reductase